MKLLFDLFPVILFFVAYRAYDIYVATGTMIVASAAQVAVHWGLHRSFERLHLVTLAVVVLFGGATLVLRDPVFVQWKPTIVNWVFAAVFLGSQAIGEKPLVERMLGGALSLPAPLWPRLNVAWVAFFVFCGALNLLVAYRFSEATWVDFKLFGLTGLSLAFLVAQGLVLRRHLLPADPAHPPAAD